MRIKSSYILWPLVALTSLSTPAPGLIILNEFNAVREDRWLDEDGVDASTAEDPFFGRVAGNGGRWFEMVVVGATADPGEVIDMRQWSFSWTDGTENGSFQLSNNLGLSTIHRGTILTFFSPDASGGDVPSNLGTYNPLTNSWWLNVNVTDADLVGAGGTLFTGNSDWQITVTDSLGNPILGPVGEGVGTLGGVSSREVGKLEESPSSIADWQAINTASGYSDGTSSSFGAPNLWSGGAETQDFSNLRAIPEPSSGFLLALAMLTISRRRR